MQNPAIIGLAASVITEVFKFIPILRTNALTSAITAIVVLLGLSFAVNQTVTFDGFVVSLVFALTSYKAIVQPVATTMGLSTQD